jgi:hypothetical protein
MTSSITNMYNMKAYIIFTPILGDCIAGNQHSTDFHSSCKNDRRFTTINI